MEPAPKMSSIHNLCHMVVPPSMLLGQRGMLPKSLNPAYPRCKRQKPYRTRFRAQEGAAPTILIFQRELSVFFVTPRGTKPGHGKLRPPSCHIRGGRETRIPGC